MTPKSIICCICTTAGDKLKKLQQGQYDKIKRCIELRKYFNLFYADVCLPEKWIDNVFYHSRCYSNVTAIKKKQQDEYENLLQDQRKQQERRNDIADKDKSNREKDDTDSRTKTNDHQDISMEIIAEPKNDSHISDAMEVEKSYSRMYPELPNLDTEMDVDDTEMDVDNTYEPQPSTSGENLQKTNTPSNFPSQSSDEDMAEIPTVESVLDGAAGESNIMGGEEHGNDADFSDDSTDVEDATGDARQRTTASPGAPLNQPSTERSVFNIS